MDQWSALPYVIRESAISFVTSASAIVITYPAESMTRLFHVTDRKQHNTLSLLRELKPRGLRGFYQGLGPALITQPTFWAVYMPAYQTLKATTHDTFAWNMIHSYVASGMAATVTNPLWVMRQRMQTEVLKGKRNNYPRLMYEMWKENGPRTFFRGLHLTLLKNVQMMAMMPIFELWKKQAQNGESVWGNLGLSMTTTIAISAGLSKIISSTCVYPLDVLRTNVRFIEAKQVTLSQVAKTVIFQRTGGARNLFRGLHWYYLSAAGMFAMMQAFKNMLEPFLEQK